MMRICIAYAAGNRQHESAIDMAPGSTIQDAINASRLARDYPAVLGETVAFGVWGKVRPPNYGLRDGDRVELYVALRADPKDARRQKAEHARNAGRR
jgi:putative ubiquitin-RnfH superfamily antitoxin RatB of RatAB toxin-antitoxin module